MSRIFVRERTLVGKGDKKPRFVLVAAEGVDLDIFTLHVRKTELDALAAAIGAEVVLLPRGKKQGKVSNAQVQDLEPDLASEAESAVVPESRPKKGKRKKKK
jgi:hypothetical protein